MSGFDAPLAPADSPEWNETMGFVEAVLARRGRGPELPAFATVDWLDGNSFIAVKDLRRFPAAMAECGAADGFVADFKGLVDRDRFLPVLHARLTDWAFVMRFFGWNRTQSATASRSFFGPVWSRASASAGRSGKYLIFDAVVSSVAAEVRGLLGSARTRRLGAESAFAVTLSAPLFGAGAGRGLLAPARSRLEAEDPYFGEWFILQDGFAADGAARDTGERRSERKLFREYFARTAAVAARFDAKWVRRNMVLSEADYAALRAATGRRDFGEDDFVAAADFGSGDSARLRGMLAAVAASRSGGEWEDVPVFLSPLERAFEAATALDPDAPAMLDRDVFAALFRAGAKADVELAEDAAFALAVHDPNGSNLRAVLDEFGGLALVADFVGGRRTGLEGRSAGSEECGPDEGTEGMDDEGAVAEAGDRADSNGKEHPMLHVTPDHQGNASAERGILAVLVEEIGNAVAAASKGPLDWGSVRALVADLTARTQSLARACDEAEALEADSRAAADRRADFEAVAAMVAGIAVVEQAVNKGDPSAGSGSAGLAETAKALHASGEFPDVDVDALRSSYASVQKPFAVFEDVMAVFARDGYSHPVYAALVAAKDATSAALVEACGLFGSALAAPCVPPPPSPRSRTEGLDGPAVPPERQAVPAPAKGSAASLDAARAVLLAAAEEVARNLPAKDEPSAVPAVKATPVVVPAAVVEAPVAPAVVSAAAADVACVPAPAQPVAAAPAQGVQGADPRVERKVVDLVAVGAPGLAYHLVRALEAGGRPGALASSVLRLAAMAGHLNVPALVASGGVPAEVGRTLVDALSAVESADQSTDAGRAMALFAAAGAVEPALVGNEPVAVQVFERVTLDGAWSDAACELKKCIGAIGKGGVPLTVEMFRGLKSLENARLDIESSRSMIVDRCKGFARLNFGTYVTGTEVARNLTGRDGEIGSLLTHVQGANALAAVNAADRFANDYGTEHGADGLVQNAAARLPNKRRGARVGGDARATLLLAIGDVVDSCREFVSNSRALTGIEGESGRRFEEVRVRALRAVGDCAAATEAYREGHGAAVAVAAAAAVSTFARLRRILEGEMAAPGHFDHLLAAHGQVAMVPGLRLGRGWLPEPYDAAGVAEAILAVDPESVRPCAAAFEAAFARNLADGAVSNAMVVVRLAASRQATICGVEPRVKAAKVSAMAATAQRVETALRTLETIERTGTRGEQEEAANLAERIDAVDVSHLPVAVLDEHRTEEPDGAGSLVDFAAVDAMVVRLLERTRAINVARRADMMRRLDAVEAAGKVTKGFVDPVRTIVEADDLLVAQEWINNLEAGVEEVPETAITPPCDRFFPEVPRFAVGRANVVAEAARAAEQGTDLGPLRYSQVGAGRRSAAREFLAAFSRACNALEKKGAAVHAKRELAGSRSDAAAVANDFVEVFARLGIRARGPVQAAVAAVVAGSYAVKFDVNLEVPQDGQSLVLPDFGSRTEGRWKVCVSGAMPSDQDVAEYLKTDKTDMWSFLFVVTAPVGEADRRGLAQECRRSMRKMLVVDPTIMMAVAAQPALRAAAMIEMAQPFSFSKPYRDYGKDAVPPEMFFGRRKEIAQIVDMGGPNVVYGARRNGKTATLRFVAQTRHAPQDGIVAAHVDVQSICKAGKDTVGDVWKLISAGMPDVFKAPVDNPDKFAEGVRTWLAVRPDRRILLMMDECDGLIGMDAAEDFKTFLALQEIMANTGRRFKLVLAGLRNVSRMVKTGNSPLKLIGSSPVRIGPFVGLELAEAERLVTRPLAAMGYRFAGRELVWRILSRCNHAPGLVQVLCERLLEYLRARPFDLRGNPPFEIDQNTVREALLDPQVMGEVVKTFNMALEYDKRYQLVAYVIAFEDMTRNDDGYFTEGQTVGEIFRDAASYWPGMFSGVDGHSLVEDVLDEMEGLGLVRRVGDERWTLRSPAVRRLLGSPAKVMEKLDAFELTPPEVHPNFNNVSRFVPATEQVPDHFMGLTNNQLKVMWMSEYPVHIFTGNSATDIRYVQEAIAELSKGGVRVHAPKLRTVSDLKNAMAKYGRLRGENVVVVGLDSPWDIEWLGEALARERSYQKLAFFKKEAKPNLRIAFVADAGLCVKLVETGPWPVGWHYPRAWAPEMIDHAGSVLSLSLVGREREVFRDCTGNLGGLATAAMQAIAGSSNKEPAIRQWYDSFSANGGLFKTFGIPQKYWQLFAEAGVVAGMDGGPVSLKSLSGLLFPCRDDMYDTTVRFVHYASMLGLAKAKGKGKGKERDKDKTPDVTLNPLISRFAK